MELHLVKVRPILLLPMLFVATLGADAAAQRDAWQKKPVLLERVWLQLASDSARQRIVLFGGDTGNLGRPGDTWEWNGRSWAQLASSGPSGRVAHAMAFDAARGRTVLFGGFGSRRLGDTWEWDGLRWTQITPAVTPPPRWGHAMAYDAARQRIVMFGGSATSTPLLTDTWEWDGTTWTQRQPAVAPPPRAGYAMAYDAARQRVVLFGGYSRPITSCGYYCTLPPILLADTWEWDGNSWVQRQPSMSPPADGSAAMAYDASRQRVVLYGENGTWEWDGTNWSARSSPTLPDQRGQHGLAYDAAAGRVIMFGGTTDPELWGSLPSRAPALPRTWSWDGNGWEVIAMSPPAGFSTTLAYDEARSVTVRFGGSDYGGTWEWDGARWIERHPAVSPPQRRAHAMAYDAARGETLLFGGYGFPPSGSFQRTWAWDGATWRDATPAVSPPGRFGTAMAFDPSRGRVVLFGGYGLPGTSNETWEWDGVSWTRIHPPMSPPARYGHAMAFDPVGQRILMFGGEPDGPGGGEFDDTWAWDGATWTRLSPMFRPPRRTDHGMATDEAQNRIILYGGRLSGTGYDDCWQWNGSTWLLVLTATNPGRQSNPALAYHAAMNEVLLGTSLGETWGLGDIPRATHAAYGAGCAGALGLPAQGVFGAPRLGNRTFACDLVQAAPAAPAVLLLGAGRSQLPLGGGCSVLVDPTVMLTLPAITNGAGFATTRIPVPRSLGLAGAQAHTQYAILDATTATGIALTHGLDLTIGR